MNFLKRLKKETALQASRVFPRTLSKGVSRGMRVYGDLFCNRRPETFSDEEMFYYGLNLTNKVVVEAGAFIGIYSVFFAQRVGEGTVLAFEPNPVSYNFLRKNIAANRVRNVIAVNAGLSDREEMLSIAFKRFNPASGTFKEDRQSTLIQHGQPMMDALVPVTTLDVAIKVHAISRVDFVKLDTEGYETCAITGMKDILRNFRPTIYVEIHGLTPDQQRADLKVIYDLLAPLEYRMVRLERGLTRVTQACVKDMPGGAYVAFHDDREIGDSLQHWMK